MSSEESDLICGQTEFRKIEDTEPDNIRNFFLIHHQLFVARINIWIKMLKKIVEFFQTIR